MTYELAATAEALRLRASLLHRTRAFFASRGVLEVETPALSGAGISDPAIHPIVARCATLGLADCYLQTSPEYAMKRLLAAGSGDIYQLCRVFRDRELGRWHQPEFTLLEWYRVGWDDAMLIVEVEALLTELLGEGLPRARRLRYRDVFVDLLGLDPCGDSTNWAERLRDHGLDVPAKLEPAAVLDLALGAAIVPRLDANTPTFICDYPASQAALARIKPGNPPVAARFELFFGGLELANGFWELADATEQRRRFDRENAVRAARGDPVAPVDRHLLEALGQGLPDCAGVAVGFDRVVALAAGAGELAAVLAFAHRAAHSQAVNP
jgi:elongation factor P--(R)-beta-lysine ligase